MFNIEYWGYNDGLRRKKEMRNIEEVYKDGLCTGCGTCAGMCPTDAIEMVIDQKKGIYKPLIDNEKCTNCELCYKICPGHSVDFKELNEFVFGKQPENILLGNYTNCYTGHSTDYNIRYNASSGGLVTQLLIFALEEGIIDGALVTRMKKDKLLEPESFIARTNEEIIETMGSKYCPVPANIALKEILNSKEGEKFAVVGLPCHIHGIRKAEQINKKLKDKIVLHLGIFCSTTCNFFGTKFVISKRLGVNIEDVKDIKYRGKGWPGGMSIQLKNNKEKFILLSEYWDSNFSAFTPSRCRLCIDNTAELADASFADYRGKEISLNEKIGKTSILSRSINTEKILQQMADKQKIEVWRISSKEATYSQDYIYLKKNVKARFHLFYLLGKNIPTYNQKLLDPPIHSYLLEIDRHLRTLFASRGSLWGLLIIYTFLTGYIRGFCIILTRLLKKSKRE